MGRLLPWLLLLIALPGCVAGELRDLTPRSVRLGLPQTHETRPLDPPEPRAARGFLFGTPTADLRPDGTVRLEVTLGGTMPRLARVRWTATGGDLTADDGLVATLVPNGPWSVTAELIQAEQRVLHTITTSAEPHALAVAATWNQLLVGHLPAGAELEIVPPLDDGAMVPGQTVSLRARLPGGAVTPWSSATAGGLVGAGDFPGWPAAQGCDDVAFPARIADGHVACAEPGLLSTWRAPRRNADVTLTRPGSRPLPIQPRALASSVVEGPDGGLVLAGEYLGGWRPDSSFVRFLGRRVLVGRPASDGSRIAFAGPDRVEVGAWDSPSRVQIPARPADVERPVAVGGDWLAIVEGSVGAERLRLQDLEGRRSAELPGRRPREPGFTGPWLHWLTADGFRATSTEGLGSTATVLAAAPGRPASVDDWVLVALRGSGLRAIHLPTGLSTTIPTGGLTELRGSGAGHATTSQQPADGQPRLVVWSAALRLFEEDGGAARGSIPRRLAGGHGGSTGALLADGVRTLRFDPGPRGGTLRAWISDRDAPWAAITVEVGGRRVAARVQPSPPPDGPGAWLTLAPLPALPSASLADRIVTVTWTAGDQGGLIDAISWLPPELSP